MSHVIVGIIGLVLIAAPTHCSASTQFAQKLQAEVQEEFQTHGSTQATNRFLKDFDVQAFAQRCLPRTWDGFTPDEQRQLRSLLRDILKLKLCSDHNLWKSWNTRQLRYSGTKRSSDGTQALHFRAFQGGEETSIVFFTSCDKQACAIVDYEVSGVLLSRNYGGNFEYLLNKGGKSLLFERLSQRATGNCTNI